MHQNVDALSHTPALSYDCSSTCGLLQLYAKGSKKATSPYSEYGVCFILFTVHLL